MANKFVPSDPALQSVSALIEQGNVNQQDMNKAIADWRETASPEYQEILEPEIIETDG